MAQNGGYWKKRRQWEKMANMRINDIIGLFSDKPMVLGGVPIYRNDHARGPSIHIGWYMINLDITQLLGYNIQHTITCSADVQNP